MEAVLPIPKQEKRAPVHLEKQQACSIEQKPTFTFTLSARWTNWPTQRTTQPISPSSPPNHQVFTCDRWREPRQKCHFPWLRFLSPRKHDSTLTMTSWMITMRVTWRSFRTTLVLDQASIRVEIRGWHSWKIASTIGISSQNAIAMRAERQGRCWTTNKRPHRRTVTWPITGCHGLQSLCRGNPWCSSGLPWAPTFRMACWMVQIMKIWYRFYFLDSRRSSCRYDQIHERRM